MREKIHLQRGAVLLLLLVLLFCFPGKAKCAENIPGKITECRLVNARTISVRVQIDDLSEAGSGKLYLFALPMSRSRITKADKPIAFKNKASNVHFRVKSKGKQSGSRLLCRFVVAAKSGRGYKAVSDMRFISNPGRAAKYRYAFPTAVSKKGLQASMTMPEDAVELNAHHSVLNIDIASLIPSRKERNKKISIPYRFQGKTYWFRKSVVGVYDTYLEKLSVNNMVVSAILLLGWRDDLQYLIYPGGRETGHAFYAWNTTSEAAVRQLQAALSFLADRYGSPGGRHGQIVNWIVGNEVNSYGVYNYAGSLSLERYAAVYTQAFRLTYQTVTSVYANARVYISLDQLWNTKVPGSYPSGKMLQAFAKCAAGCGGMQWHLAYHPYGSPLTKARFWENVNRQVTEELTSPVINMANIHLLTNYIKSHYGTGTRIILSEQGFTSEEQKKTVQKAQAAAIVYSYLLTEANDMIDSFIMNRHVDNQVEIDQGLSLGVWTTLKGATESADQKKYSYNVYKYMDSDQSEKVTGFALEEIGADSWGDIVSGYNRSTYAHYSSAVGALRVTGKNANRVKLAKKWQPCGAVDSLKKKKGIVTVHRAGGINRHAQWGMIQKFSKHPAFGRLPYYRTMVKVTGANGKDVKLKIRFYSGRNILECDQIIASGKNVYVEADLTQWEYKNKITRIMVTLEPVGGSWDGSAAFSLAM